MHGNPLTQCRGFNLKGNNYLHVNTRAKQIMSQSYVLRREFRFSVSSFMTESLKTKKVFILKSN